MGTRSLTNIFDRNRHLVTIYRQFDGYPTGHGHDILDVLKPRQLVNGMGCVGNEANCVNGMGCVATTLIACLKDGAGGLYITPPNPDATEEYEYNLFGDTMQPEAGIRLKVTSFGETLYDGPLLDFDPEKAESAQSDDA